MQLRLAFERHDGGGDDLGPVGWMTLHPKENGTAAAHDVAREIDEVRRIPSARVDVAPERALGIDRRDGVEALPPAAGFDPTPGAPSISSASSGRQVRHLQVTFDKVIEKRPPGGRHTSS
jgi:hypothetical protein